MAAALLRGTTGLCARCVHRQLCRVVWRPQVALFSSKPSDRRQPRRTHIKKAKPQPAMDVAKLLEQLFSQRRPGAAPPAARPTKPPATFSMKVSPSNVPPLSKTEPAVSVFAAASSVKQPDSILKKTFNTAPPPPQTIVELKTVTAPPLSAHTVETNRETSSFSASTVETIIETREPPVEPILSSMQTLEEVGEGSVEPALALQTKNTDSGVVAISHTTKEEPSAETTIDAPVEAMETLQSRPAAVEVTVEATTDASVAETKSSGVVVVTVEPLIETTVESSSASLETLESRSETTIETEAAQTTGLVNISYGAKGEPLIETRVDSSVEAMETVESRAAVAEGPVEVAVDAPIDASAQAVQISSTDSGHVNSLHIAKEEKMEVQTAAEDVASFEDTAEAEIVMLDSTAEATDAVEAEASVMLEAILGSEQGPRSAADALLIDQRLRQQDETTDQEAEQEGTVLQAMTLESVTLAEVEASLASLESLSETTEHLEKEADVLAGEKRMQVEVDETPPEALKIESLTLLDGDALSEVLQKDTLMEELLFSVPGHVKGLQSGQEVEGANISDAVDIGSVDVDSVAAVTDDIPASPAVEEVMLGQDVEEEEGVHTEALANEKDLDPVQRLFLEKIREYNNMRRLNGGPLEAEPYYQKYLSEETAKLQRLYGGGDLSSFPEFTFSEPKMDQDSK